MSNNPEVKNILEWTWVKVATKIKKLYLNRIESTVYYYKTYRVTGDTAPVNPTVGDLPDEAIRIFDLSSEEVISSDTDIDVYILCRNSDSDNSDTGKILVSTTLSNIDVYQQDQTTNPVELYLSRKIATTRLSTAIAITDEGTYYKVTESFDIDVVSAVGAVAIDTWVEIWEGALFFQSQIIAVNGNKLTLGKQVGYPFTINAVIQIVDIDQNKNFLVGGIGNKEYTIDPPSIFTKDIHLNRMIVTMLHDAESDSSTYGDIQAGLTYGIIFKGQGTLKKEEAGLDKPLVLADSLFNVKNNEDWESTAYDVTYQPKSGNPASPALYGTRVRKTFNGQDRSGVAIPVRATRDEKIITIFRDDLSSLGRHRIRAMGHIVE